MPGNTKPRKRKHRGTQTGSIDRKGRTSRPRSRQEAMSRARNQRGKGKPTDRRMRPPTWRGAMIRGGLFALLLFPISLLFGQAVAGAAVLTVIAALFYIPLGYYTDGFFYRRRMAKAQAQRAAAKEAKSDR